MNILCKCYSHAKAVIQAPYRNKCNAYLCLVKQTNQSFSKQNDVFKTLLKTALVHRLKYSDYCVVSSYQEPVNHSITSLLRYFPVSYVVNAKENGGLAQIGQVDVRDEKGLAVPGIEPGTPHV